MMSHFHQLHVLEVRRETDEAVSVALRVPARLRASFRFRPGQYVTLGTVIGGESIRRPYSICSALHEPDLRVAIKRIAQGRFSSFANDRLAAGDTLEVMPPQGRFTVELDSSHRKLYVAFAAGSGITPIVCLMKSILHAEPDSRFALVFGNRTVADIMFRETLEDLKNRYFERVSVHHVLSRERRGLPLFDGRLDDQRIARLLAKVVPPAPTIDQVLLCGPPGMIDSAESALARAGVPRARIRAERFVAPERAGEVQAPAAPKPPAASTATGTLLVSLDDRHTRVPIASGQTVLDAASAAGLDVPFACKGGVCASCRGKVRSGKVDMAVNYALEPWELDAGFVLTCQARAVTPDVHIDYDQV